MPIVTSNSLIPNLAGVPLDARTVCANASALSSIENPYVGMRIWLQSEGKEVIVKSLSGSSIGTTEETPSRAEIDSLKSDLSITSLALTKPANGLHLVVKKAGVNGDVLSATTVIDTLNNSSDRAKVKGYLSTVEGQEVNGSWVVCPADGFGAPYDGAGISVDLSSISELPVILFYAWYGEVDSSTNQRSLSDWKSIQFPSISGEQVSLLDVKQYIDQNLVGGSW